MNQQNKESICVLKMETDTENSRIDTNNYQKNIKNKRQGPIKRYFKEYCNSSSIHGLKYLGEARSREERFLWFVLIICSLSACGFSIFKIYGKYQESPIIVTLATKETSIYNIPFPAVTICPISNARKTIFNFTEVMKIGTHSQNLTKEQNRYIKYMLLFCGIPLIKQTDSAYFTEEIFDVLNEVKLPPTEILRVCIFLNRIYSSCSEILDPIILDQGICYSFNMLDRRAIFNPNVKHYSDFHLHKREESKWNPDSGYTFVHEEPPYPRRGFLAGSDNSLEIRFYQKIDDIDYVCVNDVQGFSVAIHVPYSIPQIKHDYFYVPFRRSVLAVVQPRLMTTSEKVKQYTVERRDCYFSNEKSLKYFKIYSTDNCKLECSTNYTLEKCGCVSFYMPRENGTLICGLGKYFCVRSAEKALKMDQLQIQENSTGNMYYCDCKPLCTDLSYDIVHSQSPWDFDRTMQVLWGGKFKPSRYMIAKLRVFFKKDSFLTYERNELYGPLDFISNFGGLLSLFTGFSLLSAVEILYFLSMRIICNFSLYRTCSSLN